ncbi:unnamed protein product [Leuciscus chuanchicus]
MDFSASRSLKHTEGSINSQPLLMLTVFSLSKRLMSLATVTSASVTEVSGDHFSPPSHTQLMDRFAPPLLFSISDWEVVRGGEEATAHRSPGPFNTAQ